MTAIQNLQNHGWYLSERGYNLASNNGNTVEIQQIIKRAAELDLKEIGSGDGDINQGNVVLQIQKLRNVAAPKNNEESRAAPRMLKLSLTDGRNNFQAIEIEYIASLSLNTPPGTKLLIKSGNLSTTHGIILLRPLNVGYVYEGKVANLVEKWELNKKLAVHSRVRSADDGGPPPWIPFGKKIMKVIDQGKNFKALADKEKSTKENTEFEAQRKDAIAEAAKQGNKKIFGGGNQQLLDHGVQKIVDQGFSIEQAEFALRVNRNNLDRALKSLQKNENKSSNTREPREPKGKRFEKKIEEAGKPSSGKVSLFDFLEDKLPAQSEVAEANYSQQTTDFPVKEKVEYDSRGSDHHNSTRGGRGQRFGKGQQHTPRHFDESKSNKWSNQNSFNPQVSHYNSNGGVPQNKPPRFQRNPETQNYFPTDNNTREYKGNYNKYQSNETRNSFAGSRFEGGNYKSGPSGNYNKFQQDQRKMENTRNQYQSDNDSKNKHFDPSQNRYNRVVDTNRKEFSSNENDRNSRNYTLKSTTPDNTYAYYNVNNQKNGSIVNSEQNQSTSSGPWAWKKGDMCFAKYWEDNMYYHAEVTDLSKTTCVVRFRDFDNYEEVLQTDCFPVTEDAKSRTNQRPPQENRRQDYRSDNRPPRQEQNERFNVGMEFRRGGGGAGIKGGYRKKGQQRSTQPIYQPPAQRAPALPQNT